MLICSIRIRSKKWFIFKKPLQHISSLYVLVNIYRAIFSLKFFYDFYLDLNNWLHFTTSKVKDYGRKEKQGFTEEVRIEY